MFTKLEFRKREANRRELPPFAVYALGFVVIVLSVALMFSVVVSGKAAPKLAGLAAEKLEASGVENPVTAVLLNFRSYDTLLEIAVLLIVAIAVLPARSSNAAGVAHFCSADKQDVLNPVLAALLRWLVPLAILVGGYLLWTGAYSPGGAFQAGAVIAGAGVALSLAGRHEFLWHTTAARIVINLGLFVFIAVALSNALLTGTTLQYPVDYAGMLILVVEIAATVSIAAILLLLFTELKAMVDAPREGRQ